MNLQNLKNKKNFIVVAGFFAIVFLAFRIMFFFHDSNYEICNRDINQVMSFIELKELLAGFSRLEEKENGNYYYFDDPYCFLCAGYVVGVSSLKNGSIDKIKCHEDGEYRLLK